VHRSGREGREDERAGAQEYGDRLKDAQALAEQRGLAGPEAYTFAATEAAKEMMRRAKGRQAQVAQTIIAIDRAWAGAKKNSRGVGYGLTDVFGEHVAGEGSGVSIGQQQKGNLAVMQSIMADTWDKLRSRKFGLQQDKVTPQKIVRELYGETTTDRAAAAGAKAWNETMAWWRDAMGRSAVFVRELSDWRLPQHWDAAALRAIGKDAYVAQMTSWWNDNGLRLRDFKADGQAYLVPLIPDLIKAGQATIGLVDSVSQVIRENRAPESSEWDALEAQVAQARAVLHDARRDV
jgi:hypothetical protein